MKIFFIIELIFIYVMFHRYGGLLPFRRDFVDNTAKFEIDLNEPIDLPCPVRIIHSIKVSDMIHNITQKDY